MMRRLLVVALVLWAWPAQAQVSVEDIDSVASATLSITTAGTNRVLYVMASSDTSGASTCVLTFNTSEAMTKVAESTGAGQVLGVFRLIAPTATTANVVATVCSSTGLILAGLSLSAVDQTTPNDSISITESASADPATSPSITSPVNDLMVGFVSINGKAVANVAVPANATASTEIDSAAANYGSAAYRTADNTAQTFDWDLNSAARLSVTAFNINTVAGGSTTCFGTLLGVGCEQ